MDRGGAGVPVRRYTNMYAFVAAAARLALEGAVDTVPDAFSTAPHIPEHGEEGGVGAGVVKVAQWRESRRYKRTRLQAAFTAAHTEATHPA